MAPAYASMNYATFRQMLEYRLGGFTDPPASNRPMA